MEGALRVGEEHLGGGGRSAKADEVARNGEGLGVGGDVIAVGPIGAEEDAIGTKERPEGIDLCEVGRACALLLAGVWRENLGELREDVGGVCELFEVGVVEAELGGIGGRLRVRQVVDDNAELGDLLREIENGSDEGGIGVGGFEGETGLGERTEIVQESWPGAGLREVRGEVTIPEIAVADAQKEGAAMQAIKICTEAGRAGDEIADEADHERVLLDDVEQPVVVGGERAGFNRDRADDAERCGESLEAVWKGWVVDQVAGLGPGNATGTRWVEEMDVRVEDRKRRCGRGKGAGERIRERIAAGAESGGEKGTAIHFGVAEGCGERWR